MPGSVRRITSISVLEHVFGLQQVIDHLAACLAPGGLMVHFVDLRDHRAATRPDMDVWSFLTDTMPLGTNRVRVSGFMAAFEAAGLEVVKVDRRTAIPDAATRAAFIAPFDTMDDTDIQTTNFRVVLRKRG